jgi:hypothetical protein
MKEPTKGLAVLRWTFDFFQNYKKKKTKVIYNNWVFEFFWGGGGNQDDQL